MSDERRIMRPIRITGNIFVTNLPAGFTDARLAEMFDPYGLVLLAYIARDNATGALRNHGLVDLAPADAATRAIAALDGQKIDGTAIAVRAADPDLFLSPPPSAGHTRPRRADRPERAEAESRATVERTPRRPFSVERRTIGYRSH
jgi:RNA recognition motif-containing protein